MEPLGRHGRKEGEGSRCHSLLSQCNAILTTDNASFVTVAGIHELWKEGEGSRRVERKSLERVCVCLRGMDRIGNFGPFSVTSSFHGMVFLACSRDTP